MQLSAACKWGIQHGLVRENPFEGMYRALDMTKPSLPVAYSMEERDRIIATFETHQGKGISYKHYAPFVKFLFWTGCRPCEAIGQQWGSVLEDCSKVHFHESIVEVSGKKMRREETKTSACNRSPAQNDYRRCLRRFGQTSLSRKTYCFGRPREARSVRKTSISGPGRRLSSNWD